LSEVRSNYNNSHYCGVCLQLSRVVCVIPQEMNDLKRTISLIDLTTDDNKGISRDEKNA
jgi:hypothetical protein